MITQMSINKDANMSKFFIEEATQSAKTRGTHTYVPISVLLEILKKEQI
jgi:hypothetical protein